MKQNLQLTYIVSHLTEPVVQFKESLNLSEQVRAELFMKRFRPFDINLESLNAFMMIVVGALLFMISSVSSSGSDGTQLTSGLEGSWRLIPSSTGVRRKKKGEAFWKGVSERVVESIRDGDSVFTSSGASAKVGLDGDGAIEILPESLVVFSKRVWGTGQNEIAQPVLRVKKGRLSIAPSAPARSNILIEVKGKTYSIPKVVAAGEVSRLSISVSEDSEKMTVEFEEVEHSPDGGGPRVSRKIELEEARRESEPLVGETSGLHSEPAPITLTQADMELIHHPLPKQPGKAQETRVPANAPLEMKPEIKPESLEALHKIQKHSTPASAYSESKPVKAHETLPQKPLPGPEDFETSELSLTLDQVFYRLKGYQGLNQTSGSLLSNSCYELGVSWKLNFNSRTSAYFAYHLKKITLSDLKTQVVQGTNQTLSEFEAGALRKFDSAFLSIGFGNKRFLAYRFLDPQTVQVDQLPAYGLMLDGGWVFFKGTRVSATWFGGLAYLSPVENELYSFSGGYGLRTGFRFEHRLKRVHLVAEPYFQFSHFPSGQSYYDESRLALRFGATWVFDE